MFKPVHKTPIGKQTGVYNIVCDDCNMICIGQTGRHLHERFKEHLPKNNNIGQSKSNHARHLADLNLNCTDFKTNCKPLHYCTKERLVNALEEFKIYKCFQKCSRKSF